MIIDILTIFPGMVAGPINESIIGKAVERKLIEIRVINIRDYAADPHRTTVTDIACNASFYHVARFAVDYRRLFGEAPSQTLKRAQ